MGASLKLSLTVIAVLAASSLLMVEPTSAVSIPEPSAPKFTVYLVNDPYIVPATTPTVTIDPYTGEQKQVTPGTASYTVDNVTIQLWILNEQSSYSNGTTTFTPYYDVRSKGHYVENWGNYDYGYSFTGKITMNSDENLTYFKNYFPVQYGSKYTVLTFSSTCSSRDYFDDYKEYPANATVDFQVKVAIGYNSPMVDYYSMIYYAVPFDGSGTALAAESDWSQTQSITINSNNTILASTLENHFAPVSTPIPLPTDTPKPTPKTTSTPPPTTSPPPNKNTDNNTFDANTLTLIIPAIALLIIIISALIYAIKLKPPTPL